MYTEEAFQLLMAFKNVSESLITGLKTAGFVMG